MDTAVARIRVTPSHVVGEGSDHLLAVGRARLLPESRMDLPVGAPLHENLCGRTGIAGTKQIVIARYGEEGRSRTEFAEVPRLIGDGQTVIDFVRVCDSCTILGVYEGLCW